MEATLLFAGREVDAANGLLYARARWYNVGTGGFLSRDLSGFAAGDLNLYRYVGNNSTLYVDPCGLYGWATRGLVAGTSGAASGAATGFAMGGMIGGPPGAAAGAVSGAIAGGISGFIAGVFMSPKASFGDLVVAGLEQGIIAGLTSGIGAGLGARAAAAAREAAAAEKAASEITEAALEKGTKFLKGFKTGYNQQTQQIGQFTRFSTDVPGRVPGSFTRWIKTVNSEGKTIRLYHDTFDKTWAFKGRGIKIPGPERHVL